MSIYSKLNHQRPIIEFFFYCLPQLFILKFLNWSNSIFILLIVILFSIPKTNTAMLNIQTDIIDRSRMKIIFLVCCVFLLSNFQLQDSSSMVQAVEGKIDLKNLVMTSYIFNSGLVSCKASFTRKTMHMVKSAILGSIRLYNDWYHDSKIEYINIFFLLSIISMISLFGMPKHPFILGLFSLLTYQFWIFFKPKGSLSLGMINWKFPSSCKNILYIIPLYSLYLMSSGLGYSIIVLKDRRRRIFIYTAVASILLITFRYLSISTSILYNGPFCLLIFIVNSIDLLIFDIFSVIFKINELQITQFASRIVFHAFITMNIFVPIGRSIGFFKLKSEPIVFLKILIYLFIIFYLSFKVKKLIFNSHLKQAIEKMPKIKKLIYFKLKDKEEFENSR